MIRPYLSDIINDYKTQEVLKVHSDNKVIDYETALGEWKIQLSITINFVSSKDDSDYIRTMHKKSDDICILMGNETDEIIKKLFESLLQEYPEGLEESVKGSEFVFDSVDLLEYQHNKIGLNRRRSYVDSPKWLKSEKATINPKINDDKCFQYALIVALNYQNIKNSQRKSNIKPFIGQYDWKEKNFPLHKEDWKKFKLNNKKISIDILFVPYNAEKIRLG